VTSPEVFRALSDPIRWTMMRKIAAGDELARSALQTSLGIPKNNLSYHAKILSQAGLISTRREGRRYFYTLRRDAVRALLDEMWALAPRTRPPSYSDSANRASEPLSAGAGRDGPLLTW
jgi:DNA-binding transcriptional ArsR family regulator